MLQGNESEEAIWKIPRRLPRLFEDVQIVSDSGKQDEGQPPRDQHTGSDSENPSSLFSPAFDCREKT